MQRTPARSPIPPRSHTELQARNREKDRVIRRLLRGPTSSPSAYSDGAADEDDLPPLPVYDKSTPKPQLDALHAVWIDEARRRVMGLPRHESDSASPDVRDDRALTGPFHLTSPVSSSLSAPRHTEPAALEHPRRRARPPAQARHPHARDRHAARGRRAVQNASPRPPACTYI